MGRGVKHAFRLSQADRLTIRRLVREGATHREAAEVIGCSTKAVQRLFVRSGGIKARTKPRSPLRLSLAEVEAEHIRNVLASVEGNKTRAAQILAIDRKTLREKLKRIAPA